MKHSKHVQRNWSYELSKDKKERRAFGISETQLLFPIVHKRMFISTFCVINCDLLKNYLFQFWHSSSSSEGHRVLEVLGDPLKSIVSHLRISHCSFVTGDTGAQWPEKSWKQKKFIADACLQPEMGKIPFKVTWPWRTRSRLKVTVLAYVALSFLTRKTMETKKDHRCGLSTTRDRKGPIQGHVTLTYKATPQGYSVGLCCIEFPDPKNHGNKKSSSP